MSSTWNGLKLRNATLTLKTMPETPGLHFGLDLPVFPVFPRLLQPRPRCGPQLRRTIVTRRLTQYPRASASKFFSASHTPPWCGGSSQLFGNLCKYVFDLSGKGGTGASPGTHSYPWNKQTKNVYLQINSPHYYCYLESSVLVGSASLFAPMILQWNLQRMSKSTAGRTEEIMQRLSAACTDYGHPMKA